MQIALAAISWEGGVYLLWAPSSTPAPQLLSLVFNLSLVNKVQLLSFELALHSPRAFKLRYDFSALGNISLFPPQDLTLSLVLPLLPNTYNCQASLLHMSPPTHFYSPEMWISFHQCVQTTHKVSKLFSPKFQSKTESCFIIYTCSISDFLILWITFASSLSELFRISHFPLLLLPWPGPMTNLMTEMSRFRFLSLWDAFIALRKYLESGRETSGITIR